MDGHHLDANGRVGVRRRVQLVQLARKALLVGHATRQAFGIQQRKVGLGIARSLAAKALGFHVVPGIQRHTGRAAQPQPATLHHLSQRHLPELRQRRIQHGQHTMQPRAPASTQLTLALAE